MSIGAHVRAGGKLVPALQRGAEIGAEVVQIFTQSPRAWKPTQYADEILHQYRAAQDDNAVVTQTFCHATYLINLATDQAELLERSQACLAANLAVATGMGASGLVLHVGSHKGSGFDECVPQIVVSLLGALDTQAGGGCPILLENAAGAGGTVGRSFEELAAILDAAGAAAGAATGGSPAGDLGICLDTQHLWASGISFASVEEADAVVARFDAVIGLERLRCLHLNDSKVGFGENRDRHENVGEGTIGAAALGALLSHPALVELPAILEVPGDGDGARASDIAAARAALELGLAARRS
jgi:deoxyribonuclease-4